MSWQDEISRSLFALWRIIKFDPAGPSYFNLTVDGFWRSFAAPIVLIPILSILLVPVLAMVPDETERPGGMTSVVVATLSDYVFLVLFPLIMIPVTRWLKVSENYSTFIIAWNWAIVVPVLFFLPMAILTAGDFISAGVTQMVILSFFLFLVYFSFLIARTCLKCHGAAAAAVVVLDYVLVEVVDYAIKSLA
jgi:hypothetical protein